MIPATGHDYNKCNVRECTAIQGDSICAVQICRNDPLLRIESNVPKFMKVIHDNYCHQSHPIACINPFTELAECFFYDCPCKAGLKPCSQTPPSCHVHYNVTGTCPQDMIKTATMVMLHTMLKMKTKYS